MPNQPSIDSNTLTLNVQYLGPIINLSGTLSEQTQNLIYAQNGAGKSYIAKAFYILDKTRQNRYIRDQTKSASDIAYASRKLVSTESPNKQGSLKFTSKKRRIGGLEIKDTGPVTTNVSEYIYHVFTHEYVESEVRKKHYNFDTSDLEALPIGNYELENLSTRRNLEESEKDFETIAHDLNSRFESEKNQFIKSIGLITENIDEFKKIDFKSTLRIRRRINNRKKVTNLDELLAKLRAITDGLSFFNNDKLIAVIQPNNNNVIKNLSTFGINLNNLSQSAIVKKLNLVHKNTLKQACEVFILEFTNKNQFDIDQLNHHKRDIEISKKKLRILRAKIPGEEAKQKFAKSFIMLLHSFFGEKYIYDPQNLTIKRDNYEMSNPQDSMSEGDKSVIDFCYYIASTHFKVTDDVGYDKLYLIVDDPVNSMSFDFIHVVCQILKNLHFSEDGDLVLYKPENKKKKYFQPKMLILTHSTYFYNVCKENGIVKREAAFWLIPTAEKHTLKNLRKHLSPFLAHLCEVYEVSNGIEGKKYSAMTGNSMRCVLEHIWRFRQPDIETLGEFINEIHRKENVYINRVLINSDSHDLLEGDVISNTEGKRACEEVIKIVEVFAPGQIKTIESLDLTENQNE